MLVAVAVTAVLVVLLSAVIQNVLGIYSRLAGDPAISSQTRLAVRQLVGDLEALAPQTGTDGELLRMTPEPAGIAKLQADSVVWLTFLTSATDRDDSMPVPVEGLLRSVSYRVAHKNPIDGTVIDPGYILFRSIGSSSHTFANGIGKENLQTEYWDSLPAFPSPTPLPPTDVRNHLAVDIVGFQVRFEYANSPGVWTKPGDTVRITASTSEVNGTPVPGGFQCAEVTITVLSKKGSMLLDQGILTLNETIRQHGRTEISQVQLRGQP